MQSAMWLSSTASTTHCPWPRSILDSSADNPNRYNAASNCLEMLHSSDYRIHSTTEALPRGRIKDAHSLIKMTSNALSMITSYDIFGNETGSWRQPMTERAGFWESGSEGSDGLSYKGGLPSGLTADVTVCKGEEKKCDHKTVQEAVDAAPDNLIADKRFVIRIQEGVYEETVRPVKECRPRRRHRRSWPLREGVLGDGFIASDLTIQNTAGPNAHQAVAFRSDSDLSIIVNCEFLSNQDTLYAHGLRQFYKSCRIEGNVDFIFGILLHSSKIALFWFVPANSNQKRVRTMLSQHTKASGSQKFSGETWKEYSRTVFIQCTLEAIIKPLGWLPWRGEFALKTLFYGEFDNSGPGANLSGRVPWSNQILAEHVYMYSVQNFIQGDEWIPTS
ncbi:unnamed protein product [Thlaspi arvense]|uniref:Pectinesterase catalytic domain-containing protein n=1 Tax=Thlaspi arvense TaxID=13288 RepID=A0AAU9SQT9_THLAR|nr:unnamed protein product [Thlaspi arvense]